MAVTVALDTNIFINVKNRERPYYENSKKVLEAVDEGRVKAVISTIVLAEMCTGYYMFGDLKGKQEFLSYILASPNYEVIHVNAWIADLAGKIRAETGIRLPDAIVVASAITKEVEAIVTHDDEFRKANSLIRILSAKDLIRKLLKTED